MNIGDSRPTRLRRVPHEFVMSSEEVCVSFAEIHLWKSIYRT